MDITASGVRQYRTAYPESADTIGLWLTPNWLDLVAPGAWDAVFVSDRDQMVGVLPYVKAHKHAVSYWVQPQLTQHLGPWVKMRGSKYERSASWERAVVDACVQAIPARTVYGQNWSPLREDWMPFYWKGYSQTTRYTYQVPASWDAEILRNESSHTCRKAIRKATSRYELATSKSDDVDEFMYLHRQVWTHQDVPPPYSSDWLRRVVEGAIARGIGQILTARLPNSTAVSAALIVHDSSTSYYLLGGVDLHHREKGGQNLVLFDAAVESIERGRVFDFEGSMSAGIEAFFRSFGARRVPYFNVSMPLRRHVRRRFQQFIH